MRSSMIPILVGTALLCVGPAFSQAAGTSSAPTMDKAAKSKACSAEADQKGLHGKARKKFRSACKHGKG
jgi:hypothetical protein